jgi:coenzyme F420-reducing hydrogenase alpha subunit
MSKSRTIKVDYLTRVEGEASLLVKTQGSKIEDVQLKIFEAPRFFEALLQGRSYQDAPDITARICGICPVAYQMSTVHAIESAFAMKLPPHIRQLRRLLYAGEWISSHCLHIFMLHAPDFLGYPDAMAMAREHKSKVEMGLRLKKLGNRIMGLLGGREIHPINVKVGGFYALPARSEFLALEEELKWAWDAAYETLQWVASFPFPEASVDYELVALHHPKEYPYNEGRIVSNKGLDIAVQDYEQHFEERQVPHSTALHAVRKGHASYLTGPLARLHLNYGQLQESVRQAAAAVTFALPCMNPYRSIIARVLEVMQALDEGLAIIRNHEDGLEPSVSVVPQAAVGYAATEAPRGLLYHRYRLDAQGNILEAKIVPPTSQNQKRIEEDLQSFLGSHLEDSDDSIARFCERVIRNYDPCISCATHFLKVAVERGDADARQG